MARTLEQIQNQIISLINTIPELAELAANNSRRAIWRLFVFVQSAAILTLEQLIDVFKTENETLIAQGTPATPLWIVDRVNKFQYSSTNPQVVQLVNLVPVYPTIDESLQIITRVGVTSTLANNVLIKVAKQEPPIALTAQELASLQSYINTIGIAGVNYICSSTNADQMFIDADIYYDGQYSNTIVSTTITTIQNLLANLPFNGNFKVSDLEIAIRQIVGVTDVVLNNISVRTDSQTIAEGVKLVQGNAVISRLYPTKAGYIIDEQTSGAQLIDTLTFTVA